MSTNPRTGLFWKVAIYYGVGFSLVIATGLTHPEWMNYLPFGGLDTVQDVLSGSDTSDLLDQVLSMERPVPLFYDAMNLISALTGAIIVVIPMRWVYMDKSVTRSVSNEVATSLLVLPLVVAAIVYIVKFSLPLAFALTGIFAGVRYSAKLRAQADAYFTFASVAIGLSAGTRSLGIAMAMATFFTLAMLVAAPRLDVPQRESSSNNGSSGH
jgi:hypothetical protein